MEYYRNEYILFWSIFNGLEIKNALVQRRCKIVEYVFEKYKKSRKRSVAGITIVTLLFIEYR